MYDGSSADFNNTLTIYIEYVHHIHMCLSQLPFINSSSSPTSHRLRFGFLAALSLALRSAPRAACLLLAGRRRLSVAGN